MQLTNFQHLFRENFFANKKMILGDYVYVCMY